LQVERCSFAKPPEKVQVEACQGHDGDGTRTLVTQAIDFYGDRSPEELAAYAVHRAARFVRLPASTLRLWAARDGEHDALFHPASQSPLMLSFSNLVEAFVLASMRRVHKVSMQKVRKAVRFVGRDLGVPRPLIHGSFARMA